MVDHSFWSGRRVFVTGHTGFKGSWLSLWLQRLGAKVVGYSLGRPTEPNAFDLARVDEGMETIDADVRDAERLRTEIARHRPEVVLHLAAQPIVRTSYRSPLETYEVNVMGTAAVLDAVRHAHGVRAVVNVTSDKCYENREWFWAYREDEPMGGHDPYSSSKGCSELVTSAFRASYFGEEGSARVATARAGNVLGGGDWAPDRLVPDLMRAALAGEPVTVRNPVAVRPWQHVLNPLGGYLVLVQAMWEDRGFAEAWNFGPEEGDAKPVGWIAERVRELWGDELEVIVGEGPYEHEARFLKVDSSKAKARLGWHPAWHLDEGLQTVVEWYRAYAGDGSVRAVMLDQIERFERASAEVATPVVL